MVLYPLRAIIFSACNISGNNSSSLLYGIKVTEPICVEVLGPPILPRIISTGWSLVLKRAISSCSKIVRWGSSPERIASIKGLALVSLRYPFGREERKSR